MRLGSRWESGEEKAEKEKDTAGIRTLLQKGLQ